MNTRTIYLAGGCFWGLEAYFQRIDGVVDAVSGYANGTRKTRATKTCPTAIRAMPRPSK
ncbi:trifunctional thioredoxin/methionine sulfoxide reductase A/B protein [Neisseria gonorrhoeae]|nr:trifunctional thioredoxin/methionine sulfoxide reductase A/B protein [Neisseria gonorrhoeae]